tara:strand:+ start:273 stop:446 length:174 start_codon:yes stop_codon:yes gene_type:complete
MSTKTKLYVKSMCFPCRGKGGLWCNYCDIDGKVFIEASEKTVLRYLEERKESEEEDE